MANVNDLLEVPVTDGLSEIYQELPKSAGGEDKYLVGFLIAFAMLFIIALLQRRDKVKYYASMVIIGIFIILGVFGEGWMVGSMQVDNALYSAYTQDTLTSQMDVLIGLRGFNVTFLDWNEHFSWSYPRWRHSVLDEHVHEALESGIPYPIYWIAEAMIIDAEYIRWGREFREAGYYTWIFLWTGFTCLGISALFLMLDQLRNSGVWVLFTSGSMMIAWICWVSLRPTTFVIPLQLGWTFITTIVGSVYAFLVGLVMVTKET